MSLNSKNSILRIAGAIALLVLLVLLTYSAARNGYAARLTTRAEKTTDLALATTAVQVNPGNADAHLLRGALLEGNGDLDTALVEYSTAEKLRPQDYVLSLQLARALELRGRTEDALSAARKAVELAPAYALPHWQLGNMLVRARRRDEGFAELRLAAASDPTLLPTIIDLAWQISRGDSEYVTRAIQPETPAAHVALANYFKQRSAIAAALATFTAAGNDLEVRRARSQYVGELIAIGKFVEAFQLWRVDHQVGNQSTGIIINPHLSVESDLDEPGFDWRRLNPAPTIALTLDSNVPHDSPALRIDFNGPSKPGAPIVEQLLLIEPQTRYRLRFTSTSEQLVSGGPPRITIVDAGNNQVLVRSKPLTAAAWTTTDLDFTTAPTTVAIRIVLDREPCTTMPCPIFGRLWLDEFDLKKN